MASSLTSDQAHALLDILSHHEAYAELQELRYPEALANSGPPFKITGNVNQTPLLHELFASIIVTLPGLKDVSSDFWQEKCQGLVDDLANAQLSEAYEKGSIGIRKTLATATAALIEAPARGYYGGLPRIAPSRTDGKYDVSNHQDVADGWNDFAQEVIYGDGIDKMFAKAKETNKLEGHPAVVQAAHEYILIHLASFMHYILVITPEGQTMLSMIKRANDLVPYTAVRQTLKIGNVASMINGMMKIFLTKMSINTVTTFLGITNATDDGMNLLQTIISTVLSWDVSQLKNRASKLERSSDTPTKEQLKIIKDYVDKGAEEHFKCRAMSEGKSEPIVTTILEEYNGKSLSEKQIPLALDYLSLQLSIRDRQKITDILCHRQPDLLTQAIKEGVAAYDPVIRALHNAVDLSGTVADFENFLNDLLRMCPQNNSKNAAPSVRDFADLLRKHQVSSHRFIHQVTKNGNELSAWYQDYAKHVASKFQRTDVPNRSLKAIDGAGQLTAALQRAVSKLSDSNQKVVMEECDVHSKYLSGLSASTKAQLNLEPTSQKPMSVNNQIPSQSPGPGPGLFLRKWQAYIANTVITPIDANRGVRHGTDSSVDTASRVDTDGSKESNTVKPASNDGNNKTPRCERTIQLLGEQFKQILRDGKPAELK